MSLEEINGLEAQLIAAKEVVARRDAALKLGANREFRKLILEDFCVTDCVRLVGQSADPVLTTEQRADALAMAQAPGHLKRFLSMMIVMGNTAAREIGEVETMLEELRAAGEDEGTVEVLS